MWKVIRDILTRNLHVKVIALLIAYGLWYFVMTEERLSQDMYVPVLYQQLPRDVTISGEKTELVKVRFEAPESALRKLRESGVDIRIDLSRAKLGTQFIRLMPEQVRVPYGVKVTQFFPPSITVNLEKKLVKEVPIEPRIEGEPGPGYEVRQVRAIPSAIRISGAASDVEQVETAMTESVNIDGETATVNEQVALRLSNPNVLLLDRSAATVVVTIGAVITTRRFEKIPVAALNCDHRTSLAPRTVTLTVEGAKLAVDALAAAAITAAVDLRDCPRGKTLRNVPVKVEIDDLPGRDKIKVLAVEPPAVSARISTR